MTSFVPQATGAGHSGKADGQSPSLQGGSISGTPQTSKLTNKIISNFVGHVEGCKKEAKGEE